MRICEQILDQARWAPSGDNTQPWRFEVSSEHEVVIRGFDTRDHCVYDLDGHPSQMALGALIETMRIAATAHGLRAEVALRSDLPPRSEGEKQLYTFDVRFVSDPAIEKSSLLPYITTRTVQRRPMSTRPLTAQQKSVLEASVGPDYEVVWFESFAQRWRVARLLYRNAEVRLTLPEAFEVHSTVIEWGARESDDKIPGQAVGVDPLTEKLMRWVLGGTWSRVEFFNKWFAGTIVPRLQLDLIPGLACAAHFALIAKKLPASVDHYVESGAAMQRFWLEVTRLGLFLQPEMTPIIFGRYIREHRSYTRNTSVEALGASVASEFTSLWGAERVARVVFFARLGGGRAPVARSTRRPLAQLIIKN